MFEQYPITMLICQERSGNRQWIFEKAIRITDTVTGESTYKLKYMKKLIRPFAYGDIEICGSFPNIIDRTLKTPINLIFVFSPHPNVYIVMKVLKTGDTINAILPKIDPKTNKPMITTDPATGKQSYVMEKVPFQLPVIAPINETLLTWVGNRIEKNIRRYQIKSAWQEMMPLAIIVFAGIVVIVSMYIGAGIIENSVKVASGQISATNQLVTSIQNLISTLTSGHITIPKA
jgi:hypothetical protein